MSRTIPPGAPGAETRRGRNPIAIPGLPTVGYITPLALTLAASIALLIIFAALAVITGASSYSQIAQAAAGAPGVSPVLGGFCGLFALFSLAAVGFLGVVSLKAVQDLRTPLYYARGDVRDKRTIGGRNVGNWLAVGARYVGPELTEASALTDSQRAAAPDRSQRVEPRFGAPPRLEPPVIPKKGAYLPSERIYAKMAAPVPAPEEAMEDDGTTRMVFRVDPSSFGVLETGEEVLVAYSRHLQHIYYVAHLRAGDWESFRNKQLI